MCFWKIFKCSFMNEHMCTALLKLVELAAALSFTREFTVQLSDLTLGRNKLVTRSSHASHDKRRMLDKEQLGKKIKKSLLRWKEMESNLQMATVQVSLLFDERTAAKAMTKTELPTLLYTVQYYWTPVPRLKIFCPGHLTEFCFSAVYLFNFP